MATTNNTLKFLKGTQAKLNTLITEQKIIPGAFYLVEGEDGSYRSDLYYGHSTSELHNLNFKIDIVQAVASLPATPTGHDFYYAINENVFAYYDMATKTWKQINPDTNTHIEELLTTYEAATGGAKATITAKVPNLADPDNPFEYNTDILLKNGTNITLAKETDGIKINAADYKLGVTHTAEEENNVSIITSATIQLKKDNNVDTSVNLIPGTAIKLGQSGDDITINVDETAINGISDIKFSSPKRVESDNEDDNNEGGLLIEIFTPSDSSNADDPIPTFKEQLPLSIKYGVGTNKETAHLSEGEFILDKVYTVAEINEKLQGLNGLEYKGVIATQTAYNTEAEKTTIEIGDTWKISENGITVAIKGGSTKAVTKNDLIIANGTEDPVTGHIKSGTLYWDIIEVDNEDTVYSFEMTENGFKVIESTNAEAPAFTLDFEAADTDAINVTVSEADKKVTVSHKTVTATGGSSNAFTLNGGNGTAISQSAESSATFKVIDKINFDTFGHISEITTKEVTVIDTNATLDSVKTTTADVTAGSTVEVTTEVALAHPSNAEATEPQSDVLFYESKSSNVYIKAETQEIQTDENTTQKKYGVSFDLVWETF